MSKDYVVTVEWQNNSISTYTSLQLPEITSNEIRLVNKDDNGMFDKYLLKRNMKWFTVHETTE